MNEKVKDLAPVLQEMLYRKFGTMLVLENDNAESHLSRVNWKLVTNEERLKYAELMYPIDTVIVSTGGNKSIVNSKPYFGPFEGDICVNTGDSRIIYDFGLNAWAIVVSRPDEKEETKEPFKIDFNDNCTPEDKAIIEKLLKEQWGKTGKAGSMIMNKEPEFQPGEMVEWSDELLNPIMYWNSAIWTGGKTKAGAFIIETEENDIKKVRQIRKIQPDPEKEIKTKVKTLIEENFQRKDGPESPLQIVSFERGRLESMLIEAFKTEVK